LSRRVSLPGASELFGGTAPKQTSPEKRPEPRTAPDRSALADRPAPPGRSRTAVVEERKSSGRIRHDTKITVYVTEEELLGLEQTRLALRAEHGLTADRGRIVREAIDVLLADFVDHGPDSVLVQRLRAAAE
jgi:L-aminopeptidase/D-esterase-like protein